MRTSQAINSTLLAFISGVAMSDNPPTFEDLEAGNQPEDTPDRDQLQIDFKRAANYTNPRRRAPARLQ